MKSADAYDLSVVEAYLAEHQPRRFEPGATGDTSILINWLNRNGYTAARKFTGPSGARYVVDGETLTVAAFLKFASDARAKAGLEPIIKAA